MTKKTSRRVFPIASIVMTLVVMAALLSTFVTPPVALAASGPCPDNLGNSYQGEGPDCTGFDPAKYCAHDAITVASISVVKFRNYTGQLELRYSPSCRANWGRFTPASGYRYWLNGLADQPTTPYGRVTVWNPGGAYQSAADPRGSANGFASTWTNMVDGTKTACTGVEVVLSTPSQSGGTSREDSPGWTWGPCV